MDHCTLRPANSQEEVDMLQKEWEGWWKVHTQKQPLEWPESLGDRPEPPTPDQLKAVIRTFPIKTGSGFDQ
eukprot:215199-Pyramimonas_sp.AAC.1